MQTFVIVERKVLVQALFQPRYSLVLVQIDVLILDHAPEPFLFGLPRGTRSFSAYADAIRLSGVRSFLRLMLLGLSCYLILALCQVSGVLVYRLLEGKAVTWSFVRSVLNLSSDLPPKSWSLRVSFPSVFEEIAFRGVMWMERPSFQRRFSKRKPKFSLTFLLLYDRI